MNLDEFLTADDRISLKKVPLTLKLRNNISSLLLIGVNSKELGDAFCDFINECSEADNPVLFHPRRDLIIPEVIDPENKIDLGKNLLIPLYRKQYEPEKEKQIISGLLFYRDHIPEYRLKLIFILDSVFMRHLYSEAYDFFSFNNYAHFFVDHRFRYIRSVNNEKLTGMIKELEQNLAEDSLPEKAVIEKIHSILIEAYNKSETAIGELYAEKLLTLSQTEENKFYKGVALSFLGLIYSDKGDADNALKYHQQALEIDKEIGYKQGEASDLGNIGLIYSGKGDADNALKYLKKSKDLAHLHQFKSLEEKMSKAIDEL